MTRYCYRCHEPLPPLPEDASYVETINHYIHEECREERDESNRRMDQFARQHSLRIESPTVDELASARRADRQPALPIGLPSILAVGLHSSSGMSSSLASRKNVKAIPWILRNCGPM